MLAAAEHRVLLLALFARLLRAREHVIIQTPRGAKLGLSLQKLLEATTHRPQAPADWTLT